MNGWNLPRIMFNEERLLQTHQRIIIRSVRDTSYKMVDYLNPTGKDSHKKLRQTTLPVSRAAVSIQVRENMGWILDEKTRKIDLRLRGYTGQPSDARERLPVAVNAGDLALVKRVVEAEGVDVNACSVVFKRPLFNAASQGHLEIVRYLLGGAHLDPDIRLAYEKEVKDKYSFYGYEYVEYPYPDTPLEAAALRGNGDMVQLLLSHSGTNLSKTSYSYLHAIEHAASSGNIDLLKLLHGEADFSGMSKNVPQTL